MSERPPSEYGRKGGAAGSRVHIRRGLQGGILVGFLILLFTSPTWLDRRPFIFGTVIVVVMIDLLMLWRGDLDYTHFQSRAWSLRVNSILLAIAVGLFAWSLVT